MRMPNYLTNALVARYNEARGAVAELSIDQICDHLSAFTALMGLVQNSIRTGYVPTMRTMPTSYAKKHMVRAAMTERLADAYDAAMAEAGSDIRAWRGNDITIPVSRPRNVWTVIAS